MFFRVLIFGFVFSLFAFADEGMWLFDQFPKQKVQKTYGFDVTDDFLHHLVHASVRFDNGGSGSFVSPNGLLFTNHHVGEDCIQKLSSAEHDYMANGFSAATESDEKACPDLEVDQLLSITGVTAKVNEGIEPNTSDTDANRMRKASIARIEKECVSSTRNRCDVVTLYSGGEYSLYQYKKYTDVRLVFAPEFSIAQFGGDPDNFTYPRYCLDFALFRAYENSKPASTPEYLTWSHKGVKDGELTFVSGNPGSTGRLQSVAQLEFSRDVQYPLLIRVLKESIQAVQEFGAKSAENKRIAQDTLDDLENSYKAFIGFEDGLRDPKLMDLKRSEERKLRTAVGADPDKKKKFGKIWDEIAGAYKEYATLYEPYSALETSSGIQLFDVARMVIRYATETRKPNEERLNEYQDANLASLEQQLYSPAPISNPFQVAEITLWFRVLEQELGANDSIVKAVLAGKTPEEAAELYVSTSKLQDVAERKRLAHDLQAVKKSRDGMVQLALIIDGPARKYRQEYDDKVQAVIRSSASKIAAARFAVYGANEYPDGTLTLRLTYGPVKGYTGLDGKPVPHATTFAGLYRHATGQEPFRLPQSWLNAGLNKSLDLNTPFDFVTTTDTHGGNSGSPTVNAKGELIGILFDGNMESMPNRYVYTDAQARSLHVSSNAIIEALRKVYHADRVLTELGF